MRAWKLLICLAVPLLAGCLFTRKVVTLPASNALVRDQLVIHSDFRLPRHHRLVDELVARRNDVVERLRLPVSDEPIHVYLFDTPERFQAFVAQHHPDFPDRRAFFLESDTRLDVYAYWGDRVAEDLRHEVTHGYLHTMVPHLPLWLDEGLAEYFEVPRSEGGLNAPHRTMLVQAVHERNWQPDLPRLERLTAPFEMTQQDYAESWAWVHLLLDSTPQRRELLQNHLARIRMTGTALPLSQVLLAAEPQAAQHLIAHLQAL
ncbi:MAG: hypothetical protein GXY58_00220 [Planctomycetaceae bacterium]|nr:hypothetical protein [Planctomycetaceae bacterium]